MVSPLRRIIHIDMDAFYASVEQRDNPGLRGKPVAVGRRPEGRDVVAAASYEARAFGVHSAMSMSKAMRLCPTLVVVPPSFKKYRNVSGRVFALLRKVTPLVEPLSLDEAYLDVTRNAWGERHATPVARRLKQQIREKTGLTASAGVAPNKFLAKVASGWQKPDGRTVVSHERVETFLHQLPVDALWGVGPVTARKLRAHGVDRLVDIRRVDETTLGGLVGKQAGWLRQLSYGSDDRAVTPNRAAQSCGSEHTFSRDLLDLGTIREELDQMARRAAVWLERKALYARTVTVKVRYPDFTTITRSRTQTPPTQSGEDVSARALSPLHKTEAGVRPIRLLGVSVHNLTATDDTTDPQLVKEPLLWEFGERATLDTRPSTVSGGSRSEHAVHPTTNSAAH